MEELVTSFTQTHFSVCGSFLEFYHLLVSCFVYTSQLLSTRNYQKLWLVSCHKSTTFIIQADKHSKSIQDKGYGQARVPFILNGFQAQFHDIYNKIRYHKRHLVRLVEQWFQQGVVHMWRFSSILEFNKIRILDISVGLVLNS